MLKTCSLTDSSPIMSMIASMASFRAPSTFFSRSHSNCEGVLSSGGGVAVAVTFNFTVGDLMVWVDIVGVFDAGCGSPGSFSFVVVARLLKDFASSRSRSFCRIASCLSLSSRISRILPFGGNFGLQFCDFFAKSLLFYISLFLEPECSFLFVRRSFCFSIANFAIGGKVFVTFPGLRMATRALGVQNRFTRHFRMIRQLVTFRWACMHATVELGSTKSSQGKIRGVRRKQTTYQGSRQPPSGHDTSKSSGTLKRALRF